MAKKPEGPIGWTQLPATGDQQDNPHLPEVEAENKAHGDTPQVVSGPNDNQGGN